MAMVGAGAGGGWRGRWVARALVAMVAVWRLFTAHACGTPAGTPSAYGRSLAASPERTQKKAQPASVAPYLRAWVPWGRRGAP